MSATGEIGEIYSRKLLKAIRYAVDDIGLDRRRLPKWLDSANVQVAQLHNTMLILVQRGIETDSFENAGRVGSDIEFFLDLSDYPKSVPRSGVNRLVRDEEEGHGANIVQSSTFNLGKGSQGVVGFDYDYHPPMILLDAHVNITDSDSVIATRYIPLALYIHTDELTEMSSHLIQLLKRIMAGLRTLHNSRKGDEYEEQRAQEEAILGRKEDSVIVLGNYEKERKKELEEVRDLVAQNGYNCHLIDEVPAHAEMNLRDKVRAWTTTSRFCIMVDADASGHNNEYEILREQETVLAILRPEKSGSTFMIGPEHSLRRKDFQYSKNPTEAVHDAIEWAETLIKDEKEEFAEYYPWREN